MLTEYFSIFVDKDNSIQPLNKTMLRSKIIITNLGYNEDRMFTIEIFD